MMLTRLSGLLLHSIILLVMVFNTYQQKQALLLKHLEIKQQFSHLSVSLDISLVVYLPQLLVLSQL
ncbi:MAG: hypothetical protein CBC58_04620 [Cellulomonadaceae bacterium TMED98]|nr:MAG: hypothetical protein CBC58_04620 [Cellulomonadaceae bacterium TMED98]